MDRIAILGSGFGLYGYLPALVGYCNKTVVLPERYREKFFARPELRQFEPGVRWSPDEHSALQESNGAVVALPPLRQEEWIPKVLEYSQIQRLFLEKPLATTPSRGYQALRRLAASTKVVRIAYVFRFLPWADSLQRVVNESADGSLTIRWHFTAHHHSQATETWKSNAACGGGPLRFYGIHLIALLAELGYERVVSAQALGSHETSQPRFARDRWVAEFTAPHRPQVIVEVDSGSGRSEFQVASTTSSRFICLYDARSPFGDVDCVAGKLDPRVTAIAAYCSTAWNEDCVRLPEHYESTIRLWQSAES